MDELYRTPHKTLDTRSEVPRVLFSERFGLRPYVVQASSLDIPRLTQLSREVEKTRSYVMSRISENFESVTEVPKINGKSHILTDMRIARAFSHKSYDDDAELFAVGATALAHFPRPSELKAGMKIAIGGRFNIRDYGMDDSATCIDASTMVQALADAQGITGTVKRYPGSYHHFWQETAGLQRIVDVTWCNDRNGLVTKAEEHDEIIGRNLRIKQNHRNSHYIITRPDDRP